MKISSRWTLTAAAAIMSAGLAAPVFAPAVANAATINHKVECTKPSGYPSLGAKPSATYGWCAFDFRQRIPNSNGTVVRLGAPSANHTFYQLGTFKDGTFEWAISHQPTTDLVACATYPNGQPVLGDPGAGSGAQPALCHFWFSQWSSGRMVGIRAQRDKKITRYSLAKLPGHKYPSDEIPFS